jgi:WD40 repeat protein
VWRIATGERLRPLRGSAEVGAIAFAPSGNRLAVQSGDSVQLWEVGTAQLVATIPARRIPQWLAFAPGGESLLIGGRATEIEIWSTSADLFVRRFDGLGENVLVVAVSADARRVAACGEAGAVGVWDAASGSAVARFAHGAPCEVALEGSGREAVTGGDDGRIARWDIVRGTVLATARRANVRVDAVAVAGVDILAGYSDGQVGVLHPDGSVQRMLSGGSKPVYVVTAHAASGIAACGLDGTIRVWSHGSDKPATELARSLLCSALAWSPDGSILAAASENELTLFRYAEGKLTEVATCKGHSSRIDGVMFPAPGLILTVAEDATLRVWEAGTCTLLETVTTGDPLVTADGQLGNIVTGAAQHVDLWHLPAPIPRTQIQEILTRLKHDANSTKR